MKCFNPYIEIDNSSVQIEWEAESEINSSHFEVERSASGSDFKMIDQTSSPWTSFDKISYEVINIETLNGRNYYRLKAVDIDASFQYFDLSQSNNWSSKLKLILIF